MGKSDENSTKKRAHKATDSDENKHKNKSQVSMQRLLKLLLKLLMLTELETLNGATTSETCANSRYSSVTALCHTTTLPSTPSSGSGLPDSAISKYMQYVEYNIIGSLMSTTGWSVGVAKNPSQRSIHYIGRIYQHIRYAVLVPDFTI